MTVVLEAIPFKTAKSFPNRSWASLLLLECLWMTVAKHETQTPKTAALLWIMILVKSSSIFDSKESEREETFGRINSKVWTTLVNIMISIWVVHLEAKKGWRVEIWLRRSWGLTLANNQRVVTAERMICFLCCVRSLLSPQRISETRTSMIWTEALVVWSSCSWEDWLDLLGLSSSSSISTIVFFLLISFWAANRLVSNCWSHSVPILSVKTVATTWLMQLTLSRMDSLSFSSLNHIAVNVSVTSFRIPSPSSFTRLMILEQTSGTFWYEG